MFPVHPKIDLYVAAHKLQNLVKAKTTLGTTFAKVVHDRCGIASAARCRLEG